MIAREQALAYSARKLFASGENKEDVRGDEDFEDIKKPGTGHSIPV
jgi:hypothetical protein